jgi:ribonuclease BN (tRNA processing enzyme)
VNFRLVGFLLVLGVAVMGWVVTCGTWHVQQVAQGVVPLDPVSFPRLTVVTVGTGGAYENPDRRGPATAVVLGSRLVLVDAGRAVAEGLRAARIPLSQPEVVLLTNLLPENTVGLDDLLLTGWLVGRPAPLRLVGPPGTRALAEGLAAGHQAGIAARAQALALPVEGARLEVLEVQDGWSESLGDLTLRAAALPDGPLPALAWRLEGGGRSVVVAGSAFGPDALVELAQGANLLVQEAVSTPPPELAEDLGVPAERLRMQAAFHTQLEEVGTLAQRAGVEALALVRLYPPPAYDIQVTRLVGQAFAGRVIVADDGDVLTP